MMVNLPNPWRRSSQPLMPARRPTPPPGYDLYPALTLPTGQIGLGYAGLAALLRGERQVTIDGDGSVFWEHLRSRLDAELRALGVSARWLSVAEAMLPSDEIERRVAPFLGDDDPLFGSRATLPLGDLFDPAHLAALRPDPSATVTMLYGPGAALADWTGSLLYVEVPKNEIQFRSRAGAIRNLGADEVVDPKAFYKRAYFVDWVLMRGHAAALLPRIDVVVDEQRPDEPTWIRGGDLRAGLDRLTRGTVRARPWFEPGPWGGQWLKRAIPALTPDTPNYAWSFELISPENGLLFESSGVLIEIPFDWLMAHDSDAVLGAAAARFGPEFPIRFDYLDTVEGGNLSLQCHPSPAYIRQHFGEHFTQDETYYIFASDPDARVYLGFQEDISPETFRSALERSQREGCEVDVDRFVQSHPARPGDLFLIPHGTVHCSAAGSVVLEISATPYIFTFKMYDWLRRDLEGNLRPLNIERAFANLRFDRKGPRVREEFISTPDDVAVGPDWRKIHLPTHPDHFYDVERLEFATAIADQTGGAARVCCVVAGEEVAVEAASGERASYRLAETFIIPAAAGAYRMTNRGTGVAQVLTAFVRPNLV